MHIWNRPWPFIYEHHNRVPMLLSVTFDEIATQVWNFYWAHTFVARWIIYSCDYFYLWPFRFVAVSVCGRFGLWPFRFVAVAVCDRFGLWPFRSVAVPVCGRSGLWPFRFVAVSVLAVSGCGRYDQNPKGVRAPTYNVKCLVPFYHIFMKPRISAQNINHFLFSRYGLGVRIE